MNASGASRFVRWPTPSSSSSRAFGIAAAISAETSEAIIRSPLEVIASVGTSIAARSREESGRSAIPCAAAAIAAAGCGTSTHARRSARPAEKSALIGAKVAPGTTASDFSLRDQNGRRVRLSALHGKLVLLTFLYTHCVDICPLIANDLNRAVASLGHQASAVRILAVSVDPRGDTPRAVRTYIRAHRLGPQFLWLLGTRRQLAPVWQAYNVLVQPGGERVGHSTEILLIDRNGRPIRTYPSTVSVGVVAHDLRVLVRQQV